MPLYAVEALDDAWHATRSFLWPADCSRWVKLALVVLFASGPGANVNALQYNAPVDRGVPFGGFPAPPVGIRLWLVVAALVGLAVGVAVLVLLIPYGLVGAAGFVLLSAIPPVGVAILGITGVAFGLALLGVVAIAQVPVVTYLRYYALFVLGDIDPDLDLIPTRRAAVRADGT